MWEHLSQPERWTFSNICILTPASEMDLLISTFAWVILIHVTVSSYMVPHQREKTNEWSGVWYDSASAMILSLEERLIEGQAYGSLFPTNLAFVQWASKCVYVCLHRECLHKSLHCLIQRFRHVAFYCLPPAHHKGYSKLYSSSLYLYLCLVRSVG